MIQIKDFPNYFVDEDANVYSTKNNKFITLKPYRSNSGKKYLMVDLRKDSRDYKKLVHRLVAEAFIPNPNNLPVVDHKDDDITHNYSDNLQWMTVKDNVHKSYKTMSPVRNFRECNLYRNGTLIDSFKSVSAACRYAKKNFNVSESSLDKYRKVGEFEIIKKEDLTTSS